MFKPEFSLTVVSRRTGLHPQLIRAWEARYQAVSPQRSASGRRVYSEEDLQRLALLQNLTSAGFSIGRIARLSLEELQRLAGDSATQPGSPCSSRDAGEFIQDAFEAIGNLDVDSFLRVLTNADLALGKPLFLESVLGGIAQRVGEAWREGRYRVAHEHFMTAQVRGFLGNFARVPLATGSTPRIIVTTPAEQWHELGALIVAAAAHSHGWHVTYLGPSLPAVEIAGAALSNQAAAVALSIVYPEDDPHLPGELTSLRRLLPPNFPVLVGGRGSSAYLPALTEIGAAHVTVLRQLYASMDEIRRSNRSPAGLRHMLS